MKPKIISVNSMWHVTLGGNTLPLYVSSSKHDGYTLKQIRREFAQRITMDVNLIEQALEVLDFSIPRMRDYAFGPA